MIASHYLLWWSAPQHWQDTGCTRWRSSSVKISLNRYTIQVHLPRDKGSVPCFAVLLVLWTHCNVSPLLKAHFSLLCLCEETFMSLPKYNIPHITHSLKLQLLGKHFVSKRYSVFYFFSGLSVVLLEISMDSKLVLLLLSIFWENDRVRCLWKRKLLLIFVTGIYETGLTLFNPNVRDTAYRRANASSLCCRFNRVNSSFSFIHLAGFATRSKIIV